MDEQIGELHSFGLRGITVNKGVVGMTPGALAAHGAEFMGDIPNFTDIAPVIQVSEVLV